MKGFVCFVTALCLISAVAAQQCPPDEDWPATTAGFTARVDCSVLQGKKRVGHATRKCMKSGDVAAWAAPNEEGCRDMNPPNEHTTFVDIDYTLTQSNPDVIEKAEMRAKIPGFWVTAHTSFVEENVAVYEVTASSASVTIISLRVTAPKAKANELFYFLTGGATEEDSRLQDVLFRASFNTQHNWWKSTQTRSLKQVAEKREYPAKDLTGVVVGVIVGFIVLLIAIFGGFYAYIQVKRKGGARKTGATELKKSTNV